MYPWCKCNCINGRLIYYHYWCWRVGGAVPVKTSTGNNFLENTRDFPEIITSTGAKFSCNFCPSVLVLVIFRLWIKFENKIPNYIYIFQVARKGWGGSVPRGPLAESPIFLGPGDLSFLLENLPPKFHCIFTSNNRHRLWPGEGSTVQWKWFPPSPGCLKALLFPPLSNKVQNKGTQGVKARYDAELPPIISVVRCPGRPVISVPEITTNVITKNFWDHFHWTFCDLPKLRNQEKGGLAKGVSAEPSVTPKHAKIIKDIGPSSSFGTQSTTAKRGVHFCKNPFLIGKTLKG